MLERAIGRLVHCDYKGMDMSSRSTWYTMAFKNAQSVLRKHQITTSFNC